MILSPLKPTWRRYRALCDSRLTLLRTLQYERLSSAPISGTTLDVGGGATFSYSSLVHSARRVDSVNRNRSLRPTYQADLERGLPFCDEVYDSVISLNTIEHIREDTRLVAEMIRVVRTGGFFFITVPFLHPVHGKYGDFHRHTAEWWNEMITGLGVDPERFDVEPLVWDPMSSALNVTDRLRRRASKRLLLLPAVIRHRRLTGERLPESIGRTYASFALGYVVAGSR